jgi:hypothetical protein
VKRPSPRRKSGDDQASTVPAPHSKKRLLPPSPLPLLPSLFSLSPHPFTTPTGRKRATLLASPARWTTSTTRLTSL